MSNSITPSSPPTTRASTDQPRAEKNAILLSGTDIHKTYRLGRVDVPVLHGASINVNDGEWVAVLGASGSGKSTLLHILGDLDQPDPGRGTVHFHDQPMHTISRKQRNIYRNRDVGFVFQFYHLLPELTVLENAMLPALVQRRGMMWVQLLLIPGIVPALIAERFMYPKATADARQRATTLLEQFGLGHRLRHRPRELSGGERQRVAIVRALINQPQVLLADEPTGNLDEHTGGEILDLIAAEHQRGLTIVMVTHDASVAERADRIVHLHDGVVVENA